MISEHIGWMVYKDSQISKDFAWPGMQRIREWLDIDRKHLIDGLNLHPEETAKMRLHNITGPLPLRSGEGFVVATAYDGEVTPTNYRTMIEWQVFLSEDAAWDWIQKHIRVSLSSLCLYFSTSSMTDDKEINNWLMGDAA